MSDRADGNGAFGGIARSGLLAVLLHPLSSATTIACVVVMLVPYVLAVGISRGIADQAADGLREGADVYVGATRFGRPAPLPVAALDAVREVPGVVAAEPRIVGATTLGSNREPIVIVGVTADRLPAGADLAEGRVWKPGVRNEFVIGSEIARRLALKVGDVIPPFYRNDSGEHTASIVGIFRSDLPIWQAHVVVTSLESAQEIFDEAGHATAFLVRCAPEYRDGIGARIEQIASLAPEGAPALRPRVVTRDDLGALLARRVHGREGDFTLQYVLVFAVGIPLVLTSAGLGLGERRREVGLLKALGWRTDEVVLRSLVESVTLAVLGLCVTLLVVWAWVRLAGAAGIGRLFVPDADAVPGFDVPFRLLPEALLFGGLVALVVTTTGSLWASWRAASAPPAEAIR